MKKIQILLVLFVATLLLNACKSNPQSNSPDPMDYWQLLNDIKTGDIEAVKTMLVEKPEVQFVAYENSQKELLYPISFAVYLNDVQMVELLANERSVKLKSSSGEEGMTALNTAISLKRDPKIIEILLKNRADIERIYFGRNLFMIFSEHYGHNYATWNVIKDYANEKNMNFLGSYDINAVTFLVYYHVKQNILHSPESQKMLREYIEKGANPNYLINLGEECAVSIAEGLAGDSWFNEYRKILLDGMKNNPPVGDSEKLVEIMENSPYN